MAQERPLTAEPPWLPAGAGRATYTVLDTAFGDGQGFIATWRAWRADPARRARLHYVGIAAQAVVLDDVLRHAHHPAEAADLRSAWPPLLTGWHVLDLSDGQVQLTLVIGDARRVVKALDLRADAIDLTAFTLGRADPAWHPALVAPLARHATPGTVAMHLGDDPALQAALLTAGFRIGPQPPGGGPPRQAVFAPRPTMHRAPPRGSPPATALVIGAGLAGAWAAHALRQQGWAVTVFDRHPAPAMAASGNPAGLFHGTVLPDDGPHARFHRAAALLATRCLGPWIADGTVPGQMAGLLRLAGDGQDRAALQTLIHRHALPPAYVQALDTAEASALAGLPLPRPAWFYPGGGWVDPAALVRRLLQGSEVRCGVAVNRLQRDGTRWRVFDQQSNCVAEAGTVVLANAAEAARLCPWAGWPLGRSRGQISVWPLPPADAPAPRMPVAGGGYVVRLDSGALLCGATAARADPGDEDTSPREADHRFNQQRLQQLTGWMGPLPPQGRVAWRTMTPDRLPLIGPVPARDADDTAATDGSRREPGLFVLSGLGSRGLTWGPLAGRLLAAWVSGAPMPVEAGLRDAVDPARWRWRAARRRATCPSQAQDQG